MVVDHVWSRNAAALLHNAFNASLLQFSIAMASSRVSIWRSLVGDKRELNGFYNCSFFKLYHEFYQMVKIFIGVFFGAESAQIWRGMVKSGQVFRKNRRLEIDYEHKKNKALNALMAVQIEWIKFGGLVG